MSAEAEATDVLVKMTMDGAQYLLKFGGEAAEKIFALFFAGIKTLFEYQKGHQKLGGKINARSFIDNFVASEIFPFSKEDFEKIKPELKRLKIRYMEYKPNEDMKKTGQKEISVRKEDADKFIRLCESLGIATVASYKADVSELSEEEWTQEMSNGPATSVEITAGKDGITINNDANFTQASNDLSGLSEQSLENLVENFTFDEGKTLTENLESAIRSANYASGKIIPISANKDRLLKEVSKDSIILGIPNTSGKERFLVPKEDIVSMDVHGGQTIRVDLKADKLYKVLNNNNELMRESTGNDIKTSWAKVTEPISHKKSVKIPKPEVIAPGGK